MKKGTALLLFFVAISAHAGNSQIGSSSTAGSNDSRRIEVLKQSLKLVNDRNSDLGQILQKAREEGTTGFQQDPNGVIPEVLTAKDVTIVEIFSEVYDGKILSLEPYKVEEGYDNRTYLLTIPQKKVQGGGRITTSNSIFLKCTSEKSNLAKKSSVACHVQEVDVLP